MSNFLFTHHHYTETSDALTDIYYDEETRRLVVVTHNGAYAGYEGVGKKLYIDFVTSPSFGRFWNLEVKRNYTGFNTGDIDYFVKREDDSMSPAAGVDHGSAPKPLNAYIVEFASQDAVDAIPIFGSSVRDVLDRFDRVAEAAGWENAIVTSVTFD